ncbi:MAG TPA: type II secretion system protein [Acidimicrobiales bacterium]|nr:type II secretion system protein [Acidimicrobiales bacterium]
MRPPRYHPRRMWRLASARRARELGEGSEAGFTLVEILVTVGIFTVLLAMSIPIVSTFMDASTRINNTYSNVNQLLPVSTNLQRLIRSAVAPAPTSFANIPTPAFGVYSPTTGALISTVSPTSLTFFANIGDSNGPAKIVASCTPNGTTGNCAYPGTFTVTEAKATTNPSTHTDTCPFDGDNTNTCYYGTPFTLLTVTGVTNGLNSVPLFTYMLLVTTTTTSSNGTQTTTSTSVNVDGANPTPATAYKEDLTQDGPNANGYFTSCLASTTTTNLENNCAAAEIESVTIDLQVNTTASNSRLGGGQEEDQSTIYLLSTKSSVFQQEVG